MVREERREAAGGQVARCRITAHASASPAAAAAIARNGYIQRFSYNCSTQYARNNLRYTGFFEPPSVPGTPRQTASSTTSRTSSASHPSLVNNPATPCSTSACV